MKYIRCSAAIRSWIIECLYFQSMLKAPSWMLKATSNFNSLKSCSLYFSPTPVRARATVHQDIPAPAWALHGLQFLGEKNNLHCQWGPPWAAVCVSAPPWCPTAAIEEPLLWCLQHIFPLFFSQVGVL